MSQISVATAVSAQDVARIKESGLFDEAWYVRTYPDVAILNMDPVEHYLWLGARLNRDPSPHFSTSGYFEVNPDVRDAGANPLAHYVKNGQREGRKIAPRRRAADPAA
ncbi:hypothetical protein [Sphingobium sp. ba1]|uniref:hypothetical protein n=1 Tax=Sphingobium sp. ba1 TaxID=1522072 RepID=UPI00068B72C1|nr:hypothetical protein [Sphingobium sp. ba1]